MLRRLRQAAGSGRARDTAVFARALKQRVDNDRTVLNGYVEFEQLNELRRALLALNRPGVLPGVGEDAPGRLNLEQREAIVADALANEALGATILQASLQMMPEPPAPARPAPPSSTGPVQKNWPKTAKTRARGLEIQAEIDQFNKDHAAWAASWKQYHVLDARYRAATHPAYVDRVKRLREAVERTDKARRSLVAYLSYRQPSAFGSAAGAQRVAQAKRAATQERPARGRALPGG